MVLSEPVVFTFSAPTRGGYERYVVPGPGGYGAREN